MIMLEHQSIICLINKSEFRKLIMAKGKAGVSSSGAAMSKYDVEVERRLQALEAEAHPNCNHDTEDANLAERVSIIEAVLRKDPRLAFDKAAAQERLERG